MMPCLVFGAPKVKMDLWYSSVAGEGDPAFKPTAMPTAVYGPAAAITADGKVAVLGGGMLASGSFAYYNGHQVYDPETNTWSLRAGMPTARYFHGAATLPNGRLMVFGGWKNGGVAPVEVYDPATNAWTTGGEMGTPRAEMAFATLEDGRVFAAAGRVSGGPSTAVELYNPQTGTWAAVAPFPQSYAAPAAGAPLPGNKAGVFGGGITGVGAVDYIYVYDPATNSYLLPSSLPTARYTAAAVGTDEGAVVIGGSNPALGDIYLQANEAYNAYTNATSVLAPMPGYGLGGMAAARLPKGQVGLFGGVRKVDVNGTFVNSEVHTVRVYWP